MYTFKNLFFEKVFWIVAIDVQRHQNTTRVLSIKKKLINDDMPYSALASHKTSSEEASRLHIQGVRLWVKGVLMFCLRVFMLNTAFPKMGHHSFANEMA